MPRSRLRPLARIGGWTGCLSACALLRWVWSIFVVQAGIAAVVAGFVLVLLARWRLGEARRGIAAAEMDSGRWE